MEWYPNASDYDKYWNQEKRANESLTNAAIDPVFLGASERIIDDLLDVINKKK